MGWQRTPLWAWHTRHGAKMGEFAGFEMPLEYSGVLKEHLAVRTAVGIFDVSHMGSLDVTGAQAEALLDYLLTNRIAGLAVGRARYSPMCNPEGGTLDDVVVVREAPQRFRVVVNAARREDDRAWLAAWAAERFPAADVADRSSDRALLALQGPRAGELLDRLAAPAINGLGFFRGMPARVADRPAYVTRTGYTGEDGFELALAAGDAEAVWEALVAGGAQPAGLAARDTLRLEAGLPLYGHELAPDISPLEAGLARFVRAGEEGYVGAAALAAQRRAGPPRTLVALLPEGGIARAGYPVGRGDQELGRVTSGTYSPTLRRPIALALVAAQAWRDHAEPAWVAVRGRRVAARETASPFYRRPTAP